MTRYASSASSVIRPLQVLLDVLRYDPAHVPVEPHQGQVGGRDNVLAGGFDDRLSVTADHLGLQALISVAVVTLRPIDSTRGGIRVELGVAERRPFRATRSRPG